jgi:hypothetical protein
LPLPECLHSFIVTLQQLMACICSSQLWLVMIHVLLLLVPFSPLSAIRD